MIFYQYLRENKPFPMQEQISQVDSHWIWDPKISSSSPLGTGYFSLGGVYGECLFFSSCMCLMSFVLFYFGLLFFCQHINSFIMYDLISRIPYTLLGQRIIVTKNDRALLINERFCFSSNSKFDSPWHFLIPLQLMRRVIWHYKERWLGIWWDGI